MIYHKRPKLNFTHWMNVYLLMNRLDRFWKNQEIQFNWKADIDTGSRSQVHVILV